MPRLEIAADRLQSDITVSTASEETGMFMSLEMHSAISIKCSSSFLWCSTYRRQAASLTNCPVPVNLPPITLGSGKHVQQITSQKKNASPPCSAENPFCHWAAAHVTLLTRQSPSALQGPARRESEHCLSHISMSGYFAQYTASRTCIFQYCLTDGQVASIIPIPMAIFLLKEDSALRSQDPPRFDGTFLPVADLVSWKASWYSSFTS